VEETLEHLNEIKSQGETTIKRAAKNLSDTYENLQWPVMKYAAGFSRPRPNLHDRLWLANH
jgi:hypothetical protein